MSDLFDDARHRPIYDPELQKIKEKLQIAWDATLAVAPERRDLETGIVLALAARLAQELENERRARLPNREVQ